MVNRDRLAKDFEMLVQIDSLSKREGTLSETLGQCFMDLGAMVTDVHSVREPVRLDDMVKSVELLLKIIQAHSQENPA